MSARPLFTSAAFTLILAAALAPTANAGRSGCADEPERCVKRTASPSAATSTIVAAQVSAPTPAPVIARIKPTAKAAGTRTTPRHVERAAHRAPSAPATPGMGTLLKVTTGTAGDISARADDGATILS